MKNIYYKSMSKDELEYYKNGMNIIYQVYKDALKNKDLDNEIFAIFLNGQDKLYLDNTSDERKIIDFIAGMTDDFFIGQIQKYQKHDKIFTK